MVRAGGMGAALAAAVATAALAGAGCGLNKFDETVEDEATIPGSYMSPAPFALGFMGGFNSLDLSTQKGFKNAGVTPDKVDAIYVKSVHLEGSRPDIDRLDVILKSVT